MNTARPDPLLKLLDAEFAPAARDAAIDALLADREAIQRMKLALAFDQATTHFVRGACALPAPQPWFRRWQSWFGPVAAAAALYAVVGGLNRPDSQDLRMAEAVELETQLARTDDRISGGSFEPGIDIFRQSFD
ncbi:MAG: hypothetical protein MUE46_01305 [Xanthomonadales bacterium]|jgi:hypothetical protein|nr:hypothetical protein [Xanthomonadales bacterium]